MSGTRQLDWRDVLETVALRGNPIAWIRRRLIAKGLLTHNGENVTSYNSRRYYLAPFPVLKGTPYVADNLATVNTSTFRFEPSFLSAYEAAKSRWKNDSPGRDVAWRLHVAIFAARLGLAQANPGDCFLELGTGRGFMAAGICQALGQDGFSPRGVTFFLMDSFEPGLQGENASAWRTGAISGSEGDRPWYYADGPDEVAAYFASVSAVRVIQGRLPETLALTGHSTVAFAHVDLNSAHSEAESLEAMRPRLRRGSVLLFDDSTNPGCEAQLDVHRRFATSVGSQLLELPTGQSLLVCD